METALEILEDEETPLLNTVETVMQIVEEEETHLHASPHFSSICRVPYQLRRVNEEAYTPMVVSIGPFHHGKKSLRKMEVQKQRYLNDFRKRRPDLDVFRSLEGFEEDARNCYAEDIPYSKKAFIDMMLQDGCFIVELFLKISDPEERKKYKDDPLVKSPLMRNGIRRDLVLLENQLPFFILQHLFNLLHRGSFNMLTLSFLSVIICGRKEKILPANFTYKAKHIVDLCLRRYSPEKINDSTDIVIIQNATRLHESGVEFTTPTGSSKKCLLDVKFTSGNLEIPPIQFEDNTETFLRNLIAFEQVDEGNTQFFSEYAFLMDCLIDTPKDVELLRNAGIINSLLGHDEEVSQLFNQLGSGVVNGSQLYPDLCKDVKHYCETPWHTWMATLRSDYFKSPWAIISVLYAVALLILATISTVCAFVQCQV